MQRSASLVPCDQRKAKFGETAIPCFRHSHIESQKGTSATITERKALPEKSLSAFTQPPMTLEIFVNLSAEAVVGIAAGHGIQLSVVRDEPLV